MATADELKDLKPEELAGRAADLKKSLFELKSKHNTGVLDSTADLGKTRKDIARCYTVKRQKELAEQMFRLRLQASIGQLDNPMRIRQTRRDIARVRTVLRQKQSQAKA